MFFPALRRVAVLALMVAFLSPGFMQARTLHGRADAPSPVVRLSDGGSFFSTVWNLLTNLWSNGVEATTGSIAKADTDNGGHLDPNGTPTGTTTTTTTLLDSDNGGHLDPNG